eukprot:TRINITY_DN18283_c0_g1_i2.p1 TRINITY_DN18283_c0_g1~~TRINITY_DN18283_c0_g1_i2.p1  ORF type:complete len:457 (-),score=47.24 TRINITY_DN18283_c0_g1_i2:345-1715(-)
MNESICAGGMGGLVTVAAATPVALLSSSGDTTFDGGESSSILWLWQVLAATCCWAASDIICDACIGSLAVATTKSKEASDTGKKDETLLVKTTKAPIAKRGNAHEVRGTQPHVQPRQKAPATQHHRQCPAAAASPVSGAVDSAETHCAGADAILPQKLSGEQNAFISGMVAVTAGVAITVARTFYAGSSKTSFLMLGNDKATWFACLGGGIHFMAYLSTLCAYKFASSTVITPLMQLSAVCMLPCSIVTSVFQDTTTIRPLHFFSVLLICLGGFLPVAEGSFSRLLSTRFWKQPAILYVGFGELLVCCYNLLMHQSTYATEPVLGLNDAAADGAALRFFVISRLGNGFTCLCFFATIPCLRNQVAALPSVNPVILLGAFLGECLSLSGICLVTFSYSSFYEPSVVNAVEGGMQQLLNLMFALLSYRLFGLGRSVDFLGTKLLSFVLVSTGLAFSTM